MKAKGEVGFARAVSEYKKHSLKKQLPFELTEEECRNLFKKPCYYCNAIPTNISKHYGKSALYREHTSYTYQGIDRLDSTKGYTKYNCVPCCFLCNDMKGVLPVERFLRQIVAIYAHCLLNEGEE